jgi:hypothetical protein
MPIHKEKGQMSTVVQLKPVQKPGVELETITPGMASKWLQTMVNNRTLSQSKAIEYAIAIDDENWIINGETIKFDKEGRLFDGQHRLQACVLAGKSFKSYVAYGIQDEQAFSTVDVGKNRSHGDVFSIAGYPSCNLASGAALLIYQYKHDQFGPGGSTNRRHTKGSKTFLKKLDRLPVKGGTVTKEELLSFAAPFKERLIAAVRFAENVKARKMLSSGMVAGCYFLFCEKSEEDAKRFFLDLCEGVGLSGSDPVYWLRERLLANMAAPNKLQRGAILMLIFKAWNKRRAGEKTKSLKLLDSEEFPKIR